MQHAHHIDGAIRVHTPDGDAIHIRTVFPDDPDWNDALLLAGPAPDAPHPVEADSLDRLRAVRDGLLAASDWTQMPDAPLSDEVRAEWQTYRQALRDLPETTADSTAPIWPVRP